MTWYGIKHLGQHWLATNRQQAINWTNVDLLTIASLGINLSEILVKIWTFTFMEMYLKMSSTKCSFCFSLNVLTHWGQVMHICISKLAIIGSDNGLAPNRCQAIIWTNPGILLIGPLGTNFSEILIKIHRFSFKKIHLKSLCAMWQPFCLVLTVSMTAAQCCSYKLWLQK